MFKILHVVTDTNIGGAGKLLLTFLANVNRAEFDIIVVLPEGSLLKPDLEKLDIRTIETQGIANKSFTLSGVKHLRAIFKDEQPHIVHTHASLSGRMAARLTKTATKLKMKVVHTRHSVHTRQTLKAEPAYKKRFPYKHLVGALNNYLSDVIIATSPVAKLSMVETGADQKKTIMIYNGIDGLQPLSDSARLAMRHKFGITPDDFVCTILARIEVVKGHKCVLKAAEAVQREDAAVKFLIAGEGSEEAEIRKLAAELGLENCIFTGFVSNVGDVLGITDLQINASLNETTNLALLEGLSIGVPAIATDCGGNPFVINDGLNGVLYAESDYVALAKGILSLKNDPDELARLSTKASEIFTERFDSKVMTAKVERIYRDLLADIPDPDATTTEVKN